MDLAIKEHVILVSGGAKGIGAAIVRQLAAEGATPVIVDKDEQAAVNLVEEIHSENQSADFYSVDLCQANNCRVAVDFTIQKYQRIDALVNNAGINDGVGLANGTPQAFIASLERNLFHYYNMAHFALPFLKKSRGKIVNIASKTAVTGQGGTSGYVAAKGGILALTREWAAELLPFGITVNAVLPAEVMTPLYENWLQTFPNPEQKLADITARIPLENRMTKATEIADMVAFLLSSRANHITGQHLFVDGGYVHLDRALT